MDQPDFELLQDASKGYVVVSVCTPPFLSGTLVTLRSFLDHNPWFRGDVVILTDTVTPTMRTTLTAIYPVTFRLIGQRILDQAAAVRRAVTDRLILEVRFYAMELFAVTGYEKLLYLDSDLLIRKDLSELFLRPEPFLCVGDGFHYRDKLRTGPDYKPHKLRFWQRRKNYWSGNFNAGMLCLGKAMVTPAIYQELLDMIHPDNFQNKIKRFHNQKLLNIYFYGRATLVSAKFNYRMGMADQIMAKDGVRLEDATILHFTARRKPWMTEGLDEKRAADPRFVQALAWWKDCWASIPLTLRSAVEESPNDDG